MRLRTIKPGFFANEVLAEIAPLGRLLFAGLWLVADRAGRLEDRPSRLKAQILPYDECDADELLEALDAKGFIRRYESDEGLRLIEICSFAAHQRPHTTERESCLPGPKPAKPVKSVSSPGTSLSRNALSLGSGEWDLGSGIRDPENDPGASPRSRARGRAGALARMRDETARDKAPSPSSNGADASSQPVRASATQTTSFDSTYHPPAIAPQNALQAATEGAMKSARKADTVADEIAQTLAEAIRAWRPTARIDADSKSSRLALSRLVGTDRRDPEEVRAVIAWLFGGGYQPRDDFDWRPNILSGAKLRKHYDRLLIERERSGQHALSRNVSATLAAAQRFIERRANHGAPA